MSYPVYIIDDGKIFLKKESHLSHVDFWEKEVAIYVAKKFKIPLKQIINLPYCQKRGRLVNDNFYFGEKETRGIKKEIKKIVGKKIDIVYDEHEKMSLYDRAVFNALKT